jgi:DNA-binding transcriptional regulator GbsR (MarR family)
MVGLPKSVGEIYGLLFASPVPLAMDELIARLHISTGAASQGLKLLRSLGAVKTVYTPGARKDHYTADLELSRFATVFIKEELQPRLQRGLERVKRMEKYLEGLPKEEQQATRERLKRLKHWMEKGNTMLPWIMKFLVA